MKIVLTGGPSAGKTTLCTALKKQYRSAFEVIPESASILFIGGFLRQYDPDGIMHQQKAIYHVQIEHEAIHEKLYPDQTLICDRGTIDGAAYWDPNINIDFYQAIASTPEIEAHRYDWVIHLDTADGVSYNFNHVHTRTESKDEADAINEKIKKVWSHHPNQLIVPATDLFILKMKAVFKAVEAILNGKSKDEIQTLINKEIEE